MGTLLEPVATWAQGCGVLSAAGCCSLYRYNWEGPLWRAVLHPQEEKWLWLPPICRRRRR